MNGRNDGATTSGSSEQARPGSGQHPEGCEAGPQSRLTLRGEECRPLYKPSGHFRRVQPVPGATLMPGDSTTHINIDESGSFAIPRNGSTGFCCVGGLAIGDAQKEKLEADFQRLTATLAAPGMEVKGRALEAAQDSDRINIPPPEMQPMTANRIPINLGQRALAHAAGSFDQDKADVPDRRSQRLESVGTHHSGDIADALGVQQNSIGPVRAKLIQKGMIYSPVHGELAFTVPLFDGFMLRAVPEL